jgi:hypothetical protein
MGEIHDWPEGLPEVGDKDYNFRTDADDLAELAHLNVLVGTVLKDANPAHKSIAIDAAESLNNKGSKLSLIFNSLERIGYTRTALNAIRHANSEGAPDCDRHFRWLAADVLANHTEILLERSEIHAPVRRYLGAQSGAISDAFNSIPPETFDNYAASRKPGRILDFQANMDAWCGSAFTR